MSPAPAQNWRRELERALYRVLTEAGDDPAGELADLVDSASLPEPVREAVAALAGSADRSPHRTGVRMSAWLVAKLRFERLLAGSSRAGGWFDDAPDGFVAAFRAYHRAVPAAASHPRGESEQFEVWLRETNRIDEPIDDAIDDAGERVSSSGREP